MLLQGKEFDFNVNTGHVYCTVLLCKCYPAELRYNLLNNKCKGDLHLKRSNCFLVQASTVRKSSLHCKDSNASTSKTMYCMVVCKYDSACLYIVYIIYSSATG